MQVDDGDTGRIREPVGGRTTASPAARAPTTGRATLAGWRGREHDEFVRRLLARDLLQRIAGHAAIDNLRVSERPRSHWAGRCHEILEPAERLSIDRECRIRRELAHGVRQRMEIRAVVAGGLDAETREFTRDVRGSLHV